MRLHRSKTFHRLLGIALANEAEQALIGLENELSLSADGWVRIAPFGDSTKVRRVRQANGTEQTQTFIQRLSRNAAEAMVSDSRSLTSRAGRAFRFLRGIPIYRRHPDLAKHSPETVTLENQGDASARGYFAELDVRDDGFYGRVVVSESGEDVIANEGLKWLSPLWLVRKIGDEGTSAVVEPFKLLSAGLTDRPNISGGDALANQGDPAGRTVTATTMNRTQILAALGLAETATDADITAKITTLSASVTQVATLANEKGTLATAKTTAETALSNEQSAHGTTRATLANERKALNDLLIGQALADARITPADKAAWEAALANEATVAAKRTELAALRPVLPTNSATAGAGSRKADAHVDALTQFTALANEETAKVGGDYQKGWARAKALRPDLLKAMEAEETARKTAAQK